MKSILSGVLTRDQRREAEKAAVSTSDRMLFIIGCHMNGTSGSSEHQQQGPLGRLSSGRSLHS